MKKLYCVKKIDLSRIETIDEYWRAVNKATPHYVEGLKGLDDFCGGRLVRQRCGYSGKIGNFEFVAVRMR